MILKAQQEWDIDISSSILVGDNETDITAGINAGVKLNILIDNNQSLTTKADLVIKSIKDLINIPFLSGI